MNDLDDRALAIALDGAPTPVDDPELAAAVARARRDIDRIRRGIALAAEDDRVAPVRRTRRWLAMGAAAAAAAAVAGIAAVSLGGTDDDPGVIAPVTSTPTGAPSIASARPGPALTLDERVAQADRIVVGRITRIDRGEVSELPYVLATIEVSETIKGEDTSEVVAFDYDLGDITSSASTSAPWNVGDEVLLFLVSDAGTVSEDLEPAHLQVADGVGGRYSIVGGEIVGPFTLAEVRAAAG